MLVATTLILSWGGKGVALAEAGAGVAIVVLVGGPFLAATLLVLLELYCLGASGGNVLPFVGEQQRDILAGRRTTASARALLDAMGLDEACLLRLAAPRSVSSSHLAQATSSVLAVLNGRVAAGPVSEHVSLSFRKREKRRRESC